jgi:dTDP-4-dehydrorhamnose reductase
MLLWRWRDDPRGLAALVRDAAALPPGAWPGVAVLEGDLARPESLRDAVEQVRPSLVVHCAAATLVDICEDDPALAEALNVKASEEMALAARAVGAALVHISSDAVYAQGEGPHREEDAGGNLSVYAKSKLMGEGAVMNAHPGALVLRTCLFGFNQNPVRTSLAEWILKTLRQGLPLPGFTGVRFSPLFTGELARLIRAAARAGLTGLYNLGCQEGLTKYDFACELALAFGFDPGLVQPTRMDQASLKAPRPSDPTLDSRRFFGEMSLDQPGIDEQIAAMRVMAFSGELDSFRSFGGAR